MDADNHGVPISAQNKPTGMSLLLSVFLNLYITPIPIQTVIVNVSKANNPSINSI